MNQKHKGLCFLCSEAERSTESLVGRSKAIVTLDTEDKMTLDEYKELARRTWTRSTPWGQEEMILLSAMGLAGEGGEVVDYYKKVLFHGHELDQDKLIDEAGDCLWYVAAMALALDVSLEEIAERNIEKLRKRYPHKFTNEESVNRAD